MMKDQTNQYGQIPFVDEDGDGFIALVSSGVTMVRGIGRSLVSSRWFCHLKMIFNDSIGGLCRELKMTKFRTNMMQFG